MTPWAVAGLFVTGLVVPVSQQSVGVGHDTCVRPSDETNPGVGSADQAWPPSELVKTIVSGSAPVEVSMAMQCDASAQDSAPTTSPPPSPSAGVQVAPPSVL